MAYYIKVRKNVADMLGLTKSRARTEDGCYLLWQADSNLTGYPVLTDAVAAMGGALLTPAQAKAETSGTLATELPEPADDRYAAVNEPEHIEHDAVTSEGSEE